MRVYKVDDTSLTPSTLLFCNAYLFQIQKLLCLGNQSINKQNNPTDRLSIPYHNLNTTEKFSSLLYLSCYPLLNVSDYFVIYLPQWVKLFGYLQLPTRVTSIQVFWLWRRDSPQMTSERPCVLLEVMHHRKRLSCIIVIHLNLTNGLMVKR